MSERFLLALLCMPAVGSPSGYAAEVTGYAVATSDYVFRGVSYSDGHPTAQGGVDAAFRSGMYAGFWGSAIDIESGTTRRDIELNYYLGWNVDLGTQWTIGAGAVAYTYPGTIGPVDYDYREYSATLNFRDRVWLEYSYSPDLFHTSRDTHHIEVYGEWPMMRKLLLGIGAGYYDVSALSGVGYAHWQAGVTRPVGRVSIDLRYHGTNRDVPFVSSADRTGTRVALSLRIPFTLAKE